jgi:HlyD family secretion protein
MAHLQRALGELRQRFLCLRCCPIAALILLAVAVVALWQVPSLHAWSVANEPLSTAEVLTSSQSLGQGTFPDPQPPLELRVVRARPGGLDRHIVQTGSIEALESAEIYANVSGYLRSVAVDIGARVEAGQTLAELDVPELHQEVQQKKALMEQARGEAQQADARVKLVQAQQETAAAVVREAEAQIEQYIIEQNLRRQECDRLRGVVRQGAIEEKVLDEKLQLLEMAMACETRARQSLQVARARWQESGPQLELARAESRTAHARVHVASTAVQRAQILLQYTRIVAPFAAVVTQRHVDAGDFVRGATQGGNQPLFCVLRTDQMKVVLAVPDRFVPDIQPGDPVEVRVDALHGKVFQGNVSRLASFQQRQTRTMRVEVDLPNPEGRLVDGMYGSVSIRSSPPEHSLTVPVASLVSGTENGHGSVYVVRQGRISEVPVWIGQNNGIRAEVLSGLDREDLVASQVTQRVRLHEGELADVRFELPDDALAGGTDLSAARP